MDLPRTSAVSRSDREGSSVRRSQGRRKRLREKPLVRYGPDGIAIVAARGRRRIQVDVPVRLAAVLRRGNDLRSGPQDPAVRLNFVAKDHPPGEPFVRRGGPPDPRTVCGGSYL